ncbi:MAG: ATPase F0F1 [Pelagibacteraceae bacterium]|nr:ATPase F0F1 [Pelagibacteraceae bacterium]|tara:strand:+ start:9595 stop:9879 length:285 start_codon:yes stop_codon:yes gene_type:complete
MNKKNKLENIKKRIESFEQRTLYSKNPQKNKSGISFGFRLGVEIVAALIVGVSIGIIVDKYMNTKPFGLIIFFILGALAGFLNIYRVMRRLENQ